MLKSTFLFKDCQNDLEKNQRNKLYQVAKRYLVMVGIIEKHYRVIPAGSGGAQDQISSDI